ncbi:endospore germination permease [Ammoniphilus sp. 3BR4]|uniref:GerAB/ArcD/ProY family transporter n=1 Tax=Ammoniphilus sp. 3BR4 TaxID=3158265 RepID=UPI003465AA51
MDGKAKISVSQFFLLALFFIIGTSILLVPAGLAADAKQDAWIAAILGIIFTLLVVWLYTILGKQFGDQNLVEFSENVLGKWVGGFISLNFIYFGIHNAASLCFYVGNFIVTQIMTETPIQFINATFAIVIIMGIRLGLETVARAAEILIPWFVGMYLVVVLSVLPDIELSHFMPVLENGIQPVLKAAIPLAATSGFVGIVFLMFYPSVINNKQKASKAFLHAAWVGGSFIVIITALCIIVLGPDLAARQMFPTYALAKKIEIAQFLQRIEALVAAMWVLSIYFKATLYLYSSITGLAQILRLQSYRTLTIPMGLIMIVLSLVVYPNTVYMGYADKIVFVPYSMAIGLGIPFLLLLVAHFRKRKGALKKGS